MRDPVYVFNEANELHGIYEYGTTTMRLNKEFGKKLPKFLSYNTFNQMWSKHDGSWSNTPSKDVPPEILAQLLLLGVYVPMEDVGNRNPFKRVKQ